MRRHLSYSNVLATLSLFIVLGGSAWAAAKINGKNLKNRSVAAKKIKKNTLGGNEIREARLGVVPNASKLAGLDAAAFLRSDGKAQSAANADNAVNAANAAALGSLPASAYLKGDGQQLVYQGALEANAADVNAGELPGVGNLEFDCDPTADLLGAGIKRDNPDLDGLTIFRQDENAGTAGTVGQGGVGSVGLNTSGNIGTLAAFPLGPSGAPLPVGQRTGWSVDVYTHKLGGDCWYTAVARQVNG